MSGHFPPRPKSESIRTRIWNETASESNPFVARKTLCHGYDFDALLGRFSWTKMLFLLLRGELPTAEQDSLLNLIMSAVINPGPRDAAVRAAMNCGVGKTPVATILTTGLMVRGGMAEGSMHVETSMRFLLGELLPGEDSAVSSPDRAAELIRGYDAFRLIDPESEVMPLPEHPPGFGLYFGDRDPRVIPLLEKLEPAAREGKHFNLAIQVESVLSNERGIWLTLPGVFAALCCELGLSPEQGGGLFLIAGSAGILAHGVEQLPRKWSEYPFWSDPGCYEYVGPEPTKMAGESS